MADNPKWLTVEWDHGETYDFYVLDQIRFMLKNNVERCKAVYRGYFAKNAPNGLEPGVIYWLKQIKIQSGRAYPQLREQYDLVEFPQDKVHHIRQYLLRNPMAKKAAKAISEGKTPEERDDYYVVERSYAELIDRDIQHLTPWERLDYLDQYCRALKELYGNSRTIFGHSVVAHRDVKIQNGLIFREENRFTVKLLDFSAIRFGNDPEYVPIDDTPSLADTPHDGSQGTEPYLMSQENTCLELINAKYPTTGATDVFALGTMLASMFGYVTSDRRNPNSYCCTVVSTDPKKEREFMDHDALSMLLESWIPRDKQLIKINSSVNWMEKMLFENNTPFTWGDPPGAPYSIDDALLAQVKDLVFRTTHIDPQHRITLQEFHEKIREMKRNLGKDVGRSPKLYLKPENIWLIHQRSLSEHRVPLENDVRKLLEQEASPFPVRLAWYRNPEDGCYSKKWKPLYENVKNSPARIISALQTHDAMGNLSCCSLTDALHQLYTMYIRYEYESCFSGTLHIFTFSPITAETLKVERGGVNYDFVDFLEYLSDCTENQIKVYIHSPYEPRLLRHPAIQWVGSTESAPPQNTTPDENPVQEKKPERPPEVEPDPIPVQKPKMQVNPETLYLRGSEGIFFLDGEGRKVYVSRRKIGR